MKTKKKIEFQFSKLQCHSDTMFINTECGGVVRAINSISFSWPFFCFPRKLSLFHLLKV